MTTPVHVEQRAWPRLRDVMGPGLITGASDDDPSGIATYSQAGAQFGYAVTWTLVLTYPLMCAIQLISAHVGRVTGRGLAGNLRRHHPAWLLHPLVGMLVIANTINLGADLGAMAAALHLLIAGPTALYVVAFAFVTVVAEVFVRYDRYASILRWLTLSLFAYVGTVFVVGVPWWSVAKSLVLPHISLDGGYLTVIVAVFGTTISPYLFFWQAGEEVENEKEDPAAKPLIRAPEQAPAEMARMQIDTLVGMGFSNLIALFIMLTTAATLHAHGVTDIQTSSQAAEALRPIAGRFAFTVFALGVIGTGLLAVPVLAGSAAYAVGEALGWRVGLTKRPGRARAFYGVIALATLVGAALNLTPLDPIKALFWSAVINGVAAVPIMVMIMLMASRPKVMGPFALGPVLKAVGWLATAVMGLAAIGMFATLGG
ncbi:Mn2+/Fe2+ NRAMP family transporter [Roseiarcus fermentans]|uniref:Mn2+/Fe2+ NRAMP family transporter n=1 Tax=Roseiarcus fermentans TaxID=1473586 RepID=A0A366F662_9HYPH|nr:divalent metal cation transporter [Roseiarcus fermentans]RBP09195.1 Mn2+/Fe2+ NRAMP family transporter [Roseiarcus fermentans]